MRAFVTCDVEAKQIEVFPKDAALSVLSEAIIDFGKTPELCSDIC